MRQVLSERGVCPMDEKGVSLAVYLPHPAAAYTVNRIFHAFLYLQQQMQKGRYFLC